MTTREPRIIDEIKGIYDGRKVDEIHRENGKKDFKVRKTATKRRELMKPRVVKTDYYLDPQKDIHEIVDQDGERRIYLLPISRDLQVHQENTVHHEKMQKIGESFERDDQRIEELERRIRKLKRRLARQADGDDEQDQEQASAPQQRYECQTCGKTVTENQKEENDDRCPQCNRETLELMDNDG